MSTKSSSTPIPLHFCEKHPKTASRIEKFLDQIVVELEEELAKSEIFQGGNGPNGPVISERASRPLISETDPEVRYEAIHQIVKADPLPPVAAISDGGDLRWPPTTSATSATLGSSPRWWHSWI